MFDFAYFREQMCVTICPYAKLQSVLMDRDSMIVSYDPNRGEPRGRRNREQRKKEADGVELDLGDCIDCGACVRTCPTGIDIREGLQLECVSCTQCIDACNDIMRKVDKPEGLIRYTSENALEGEETNIVRPRVILYAALLLLAAGTLGFLLTATGPVEVDLRRAPGTAFTRLENAGGQIANQVSFRVRNNTGIPVKYSVEPLEPEEASMKMIGPSELEIAPGDMDRIKAWVLLPESAFKGGSTKASFQLLGDGDKLETVSMEMLGPDTAADEPSEPSTDEE
jgi:cytochrome c oxidase accessory protein FixG